MDTRNAKGVRLGVWAREAFARLATRSQNYLRDLFAPFLLSLAAILVTSFLLLETHARLTALHIWHDPEDLALAYILPTIFVTVLFGSSVGVFSVLVSGMAAAYFIYPPAFSIAIDSPEHLVELGLFLALSLTACKSTAILSDEKSFNRRPARKLNKGNRSRALRSRFWSLDRLVGRLS